MKRLIATLVFLAAAAAQTSTYTNARYGYSVSYPSALLTPQGESGSGDGQEFLSKDKRFQLLAWGSYNALEQTIPYAAKQYIELESKKRPFKLTYKVVKDAWYVYSGLSGDNIVYQKGFLQDEIFTTIRLEYPLADKDKLDPAVKQIIASFPGKR